MAVFQNGHAGFVPVHQICRNLLQDLQRQDGRTAVEVVEAPVSRRSGLLVCQPIEGAGHAN
jgi:hypothetical protein